MVARSSPSVFISYSWDSLDHKNWVRHLAERMVRNDVDVKIDQWHVAPGESLTAFMELEIQSCDFVAIICTPNYAKRSTSRAGGVGYEQQIISGSISSGVKRKKFIPIVRSGNFEQGDDCAIPPHFLGILAIDMRDDTIIDSSFETLLRVLYDQPAFVPPARGKRPEFFPSPSSDATRTTRLPTIDIDTWQLISGVASNERAPATFKIPKPEHRESVHRGDLVKLMFEIVDDDEANSDLGGKRRSIERMWVRVKERNGPYIIGTLRNKPAANNEKIKFGNTVTFLPEHIINIMPMDELSFVRKVEKLAPEVAREMWLSLTIKKEDRSDFLKMLRSKIGKK